MARPRHTLPALATACLLATVAASPAGAHGDPSSYLETDQLYPGFANRPSQDAELALTGLLEAARRSAYPVKLSIVGSADDLVEDPSLYARPQGHPLPAVVPAAQVLAPGPAPRPQETGSFPALPIAIFLAVFLTAWLFYELRAKVHARATALPPTS